MRGFMLDRPELGDEALFPPAACDGAPERTVCSIRDTDDEREQAAERQQRGVSGSADRGTAPVPSDGHDLVYHHLRRLSEPCVGSR